MEVQKPYLAVLVIQIFYTGMHILSKAALDDGMKPYILVFYRQAVATFFLAPIAFFLEWITLSWNLCTLTLGYTSAPLVAATTNTIPVFTFFLAVIFRMENVNLRTIPSISKLAGIAICLGGAATVAFFSGPPYLRLLVQHHLFNNYSQDKSPAPSRTTWIKGVFLMLLSVTSWSSWLVLQGLVLKSHPSMLLFTTLQSFLSTIESFIIAIALERDHHEWKLGWDVRLLTVAYCGILVSGVTFCLQSWVIEKKGPVFQAMWTPLVLIFTICSSAVLFGEIISLGSVLGAILLVVGLYCVLWGKTREQSMEEGNCASTTCTHKQCTTSRDDTVQGRAPKQLFVQDSCSCV